MNKIILLTIPIMLLGMVIPHAMANGSAIDRYNQGWADGQNQAINDWNSHTFSVSSGGNSVCPDGHSHAYCQGWNAGYADEWNRSIQANTNLQQSQTSGVNIKGDNNRVTVQQGQNAGDSSGSDGSGGSGNPQCRILCSVIH